MTSAPLKIIIAGGGTGGHLFPAISLAQRFMSDNDSNRILFVGAGRPIEIAVTARYGFEFEKITAEGLKGRGLFNQAKALAALSLGVLQSRKTLKSFQPDLVVGMGGYSAAPVVFAARLSGVPVVLCEQNILPGIANRVLSRFADRVYVSFENTMGAIAREKIRHTGNPVRREILEIERLEKSETDPFTVLILGGSQGARGINAAAAEALDFLKDRDDLFFIHQTGTADEDFVKAAYARKGVAAEVKAFFDDMARVYAKADLAVCRAGATTIAELTAVGMPAFFIPFPYAADDHQALNARNLCQAGAAEMALEKDLTGGFLAAKIAELAENRTRLNRMAENARAFGRPDAAAAIARDCYDLIERKTGNRKCI